MHPFRDDARTIWCISACLHPFRDTEIHIQSLILVWGVHVLVSDLIHIYAHQVFGDMLELHGGIRPLACFGSRRRGRLRRRRGGWTTQRDVKNALKGVGGTIVDTIALGIERADRAKGFDELDASGAAHSRSMRSSGSICIAVSRLSQVNQGCALELLCVHGAGQTRRIVTKVHWHSYILQLETLSACSYRLTSSSLVSERSISRY